jgi:diguanylate cyclase (GGDEF)-like protein
MGFRLRLALFLVATLAAVQLLTAVLVYGVTRNALIKEGERQLAETATVFVRQLDDVSERVAENVEVLVLDYALRAAIAQRDQATVLSALRNHGRRVGAERMLLIGLDGTIEADTVPGAAPSEPKTTFPFPDLIASAFERRSAAMVALDGKAYWMVVVPVYAPQPVALIAAGIPIDDALVARMQSLSALPRDIELSTLEGADWKVLAHGQHPVALTERLMQGRTGIPGAPTLLDVDGQEYVALAVRLDRSQGATPMAAVLGYSVDEALRPYRSVASSWAVLVALGAAAALLGALLIARGVSRPVEALAATARRITDGDYEASPPVSQTGEIGHLAAAFASMTEAIREREQRIRYQAEHDQVTGLRNRPAAEQDIRSQLATQPEQRGALLVVGLARLPEIIKTIGHEVSDRLLRDAGTRVQQLAGKDLVARAGDTQLLLWREGAREAEAIALAFRVVDALGEPYQEEDLTLDLSPAVGIALHPEHGADAGALVRRADVALFAAQAAEEPVAVYDPATDPHRPERLALMGELREALDHAQLMLHYQPKLNLASSQIDGAEGLVRWQHPRRGLVSPDEFIPLAEESGNIRRLTRWALAAGIAQAASWHAGGAQLRVAINLSARDLDDEDLPRRIAELLAAHRVKPAHIGLEITESAVMGKPDTAIAVLQHIAELGIPIALDDFGVGQSSFAYLRRLPVREIKIDKSFVQQLADEAGDRTIVRSIVELGHRLGFKVTAEGVESADALDYLAEIGCDHAQGYYIAEPLPPESVPAFLEHRCWRAAKLPANVAKLGP